MSDFRCLRVTKLGSQSLAKIETLQPDQLTKGDVTVRVYYSGINYKDALAVTGKGAILRSSPLNPGIDLAGEVLHSESPLFKPGDQVLAQGQNTGELYDGGFSEVARLPSANLIPLPSGLSLRQAMILGTAGFTAALCRSRMEQMGQRPELGPILISGASGGVGSFAVQIFSQAGYQVVALSDKSEAAERLRALGAWQVANWKTLELGNRPLESVRFGGAVDNLGGESLAKAMAHIQLWGNIACVGLASSHELHTTLMPLILRGVSLLGISSNNAPGELRRSLWQKLAGEWKPKIIEDLVFKEITLDQVAEACVNILNRKTTGRYLVRLK